MKQLCHVCGEYSEHATWKSTTCNACLAKGFKWCNECKTVKPLVEFNKTANSYCTCCKPCKALRSKRSYISTGYMQREDTKSKRNVAKQKYYGTEAGHALVNKLVRERQYERYHTEEDYRRNKIAQCHARRNAPGAYSSEDVAVAFEFFDNSCAYCGTIYKLTIDHLTALAAGGTNDVLNLVPSCLSCNCSKGAKYWKEWFKTQKFFTEERYNRLIAFEEVM